MGEVITEYVGNTSGVAHPQYRWWLAPENLMHQHIWQIVNSIDNNQGRLRLIQAKYVAMYSNSEFYGLSSKFFSRSYLLPILNGRLSLNVIKSCIDSAAAKIAKNRPRPFFLTNDGDWSQQRKAKNLTKFMEGVFEEANIYEAAQAAFVDSAITGLGVLHPYYENGRFEVDRIFPEELTFDDADAIYGRPTQIHRLKYIPRDLLCELYPKYEHQIRSAMPYIRYDLVDRSVSNSIAVRESWHLPTTPESGDGRHVISIENCTLLCEDYTKPYFPFVFFRWCPRVYGFSGSGLAEELWGIQAEVNNIIRSIQRAIHYVGVPRIWIENGSMFDINTLTNEVASIGTYTGTPPSFQVYPSMSSDVYAYLQDLFIKAYNITGISLLSATSTKPSGVNAAVAMREYQDIETERFSLVAQRYEKSFLDLSRIYIDIAKDEEAKGNKIFVKSNTRKSFISTIGWKEVDIPADKYVLRTFPTSLLPSQPQGKLSMIQELTQAGFLTPEDAKSLLDFPDLEGVLSLYNSARDDIMMVIEMMLDEGKPQKIEPFMNVRMASVLVQSAYLKAKQQGAPEDRLELMREFMQECQQILNPPVPALPAVPTLPGGSTGPSANPGVVAPLAKSEPMNRNELIPNIPSAQPKTIGVI
jgi:hypothetical protein